MTNKNFKKGVRISTKDLNQLEKFGRMDVLHRLRLKSEFFLNSLAIVKDLFQYFSITSHSDHKIVFQSLIKILNSVVLIQIRIMMFTDVDADIYRRKIFENICFVTIGTI